MKRQTNLATRYAKALLELGESTGKSSEIGAQLAQLDGLLQESKDLNNVFSNPGFDLQDRKAILQTIIERLDFLPQTRNFVLLLVDKKRTPLFAAIVESYQILLDRQRKHMKVHVTSAKPLSETYLEKLRQHLHEQTEQNIEIHTEVDESLLAGIRVWVGGKIYDGSLQTRLSRVKEHLLQQV